MDSRLRGNDAIDSAVVAATRIAPARPNSRQKAYRRNPPTPASSDPLPAGSAGACQLLNDYDLIGGFDTFKPKFAKRYGNVAEVATHAFEAFVADVRAGTFPDDEHSYTMPPAETEKLAVALQAGKSE